MVDTQQIPLKLGAMHFYKITAEKFNYPDLHQQFITFAIFSNMVSISNRDTNDEMPALKMLYCNKQRVNNGCHLTWCLICGSLT